MLDTLFTLFNNNIWMKNDIEEVKHILKISRKYQTGQVTAYETIRKKIKLNSEAEEVRTKMPKEIQVSFAKNVRALDLSTLYITKATRTCEISNFCV